MEARVSQVKSDLVKKFSQLIDSYPYVGLVNMENLPAKQLQTMRAKMREKAIVLRMTKRRLIFKAIDASKKKDIGKLKEYTRGMPALIFTKQNPFKIYATLKKNKSSAPAKAGQTAPNDIIVNAGTTSFAPGPIIGELGAIGIKTKVDGGKIAILSDTKVAKEGDEISEKLASMLTRLNILPMEVGLAVTAI